MKRINKFGSADLKRISEYAIPAIKACFKKFNFGFTEYDVEAVLSETFWNVYKGYETYDESISKRAWFSTIAWNNACDYCEKEGRKRGLFVPMVMQTSDKRLYEMEYSDRKSPESCNADAEAISDDILRTITKVSESFGKDNATLLEMHAMGYSNKEIAERLGWSEGQTKTRKSRLLKAFGKHEEIIRLCAEYQIRNIAG